MLPAAPEGPQGWVGHTKIYEAPQEPICCTLQESCIILYEKWLVAFLSLLQM